MRTPGSLPKLPQSYNEGGRMMATLDITCTKRQPARSLGILLNVLRRLIADGVFVSSRARVRASSRDERTDIAALTPRWTRETENPFDVPTSTYRDVIP